MLTDEDTELVMGESVLVGIDEAQFFTNIDRIVIDFQSLGCSVVCSGLDLDSFGSSFGKMGELLCLANVVVKHKASCAQCSDPATKTFRKITASTEKVLIGGTDLYEPRCHEHWMQGISTWEKAMKKVL
jgi:thymidine kinase